MSNKNIPSAIVLHRGKEAIEYELVVFRVDLWDEQDRPLQTTLIRMDDVAELDRNPDKNHFFLGYFPKDAKR